MNEDNIHPIFDRMQSRADKERQLGQRGMTLWFTGLSGSGKSTIAVELERKLSERGVLCHILDGDNVRSGINRGLGFSNEDRRENIRRIAEVCRLFTETGIVTLATFVSPTNELRAMARAIIGDADYREIYISTPIEECERRDVKGLYKKARQGLIKDFTGVTSPFEAPISPALVIDTTNRSVEECVNDILSMIQKSINNQ